LQDNVFWQNWTKKEGMSEEPEEWGSWALRGMEEARAGPTSTK